MLRTQYYSGADVSVHTELETIQNCCTVTKQLRKNLSE